MMGLDGSIFVKSSKYAFKTIGITLVFGLVACIALASFLNISSGWGYSFIEWLTYSLQFTGILTICVAFIMDGGKPMQAKMKPPGKSVGDSFVRCTHHYYVPEGKEKFTIIDDFWVTFLMIISGVILIATSFIL